MVFAVTNSMNPMGFEMNNSFCRLSAVKTWGGIVLLCGASVLTAGLAILPARVLAADAHADANANANANANATPTAGPLELKFRDFYQSPVGPAGLQPSAQLRAAHAQRVRLKGYMVAQEEPGVGHFFLTPLPVTMSAHADGEADDLPPSTVLVQMPDPDSALPVLATPGLLQLTGRLQVGRFEMRDGRVVWLRLLLEPRAAPAR